jgi:hypothetical protein
VSPGPNSLKDSDGRSLRGSVALQISFTNEAEVGGRSLPFTLSAEKKEKAFGVPVPGVDKRTGNRHIRNPAGIQFGRASISKDADAAEVFGSRRTFGSRSVVS